MDERNNVLETRNWTDVDRKVQAAAWTVPLVTVVAWIGEKYLEMPTPVAAAFGATVAALAAYLFRSRVR